VGKPELNMRLLLVVLLATLAVSQALVKEEIEAKEYLENLNKELAKRTNVATEAAWAYGSNVTAENAKKKIEVSAELAKFKKEVAGDTAKFQWRSFQSEDLKRQFKALNKLGYAALPEADFTELLQSISAMETNYAKVKVCDYKDKSTAGESVTYIGIISSITT